MKNYNKLKLKISRIEKMVKSINDKTTIKVKCWCEHWAGWWASLIKKMKGGKTNATQKRTQKRR
tara:strand:+ start:97 stop:288 length:192 start_codon:yes stop_codon:yes gene_type:complete